MMSVKSSGYTTRKVKYVNLASMFSAVMNACRQEKYRKVDRSSKIKGKSRQSHTWCHQYLSQCIAISSKQICYFCEEANFNVKF